MYVPAEGAVEPFTKFNSSWITRSTGKSDSVARHAESALELCSGIVYSGTEF